jgi:hypothetical protein
MSTRRRAQGALAASHGINREERPQKETMNKFTARLIRTRTPKSPSSEEDDVVAPLVDDADAPGAGANAVAILIDAASEVVGPESETPGEESPASGEESPASGEESPASGEESPASGEESPTSGEESPASGEEYPASGEETPAFSDEAPPASDPFDPPASEAPPASDLLKAPEAAAAAAKKAPDGDDDGDGAPDEEEVGRLGEPFLLGGKKKRKVQKRLVGSQSTSIKQMKDAVVRTQAVLAAYKISTIQAMTTYATVTQSLNNPRSDTILLNYDQIVERPDKKSEGERSRSLPKWTLLAPVGTNGKELGFELEKLGKAMQEDKKRVVGKGKKVKAIDREFDYQVVDTHDKYLASIYGSQTSKKAKTT